MCKYSYPSNWRRTVSKFFLWNRAEDRFFGARCRIFYGGPRIIFCEARIFFTRHFFSVRIAYISVLLNLYKNIFPSYGYHILSSNRQIYINVINLLLWYYLYTLLIVRLNVILKLKIEMPFIYINTFSYVREHLLLNFKNKIIDLQITKSLKMTGLWTAIPLPMFFRRRYLKSAIYRQLPF